MDLQRRVQGAEAQVRGKGLGQVILGGEEGSQPGAHQAGGVAVDDIVGGSHGELLHLDLGPVGDGPLKPRPPVEEERDPEQRFPHDGLFRRQGVADRQQKPPPGRAGESQIVIFHPVHRHEEDGEVQAPVVQPFQHLRLVAAVKGKMDVRMLLPQTGGGAQQADVRVAAHGDLPAQKSGVGPELGLGLVQKGDDVLGPLAQEDVHKAVHTSVLVSLLGGGLVAVLGELIASPLLGMLNVPADVFPLALLYLRIYLAGMPVILLYNFEAAIFRSVGETRIPLAALATSGVLNVALNLFFVAVLHMTVNGVAIATVISNAVSAALLWRRLRRTDKVIRLEPRQLRVEGKMLLRILRIGLPAGVQSAVFALSNIVVQAAINSLGTVVMAASSAAFNIEVITYDILNSFSQACTTFVGQNYGAGELRRCKRTLALCLAEGIATLAAAIAVILFFGKDLLSIFNSDPEVVETGYIRLTMIMMAHSFSLLYEVMSGYLRGFGISLTPALLTILGVCGTRVAWIRLVFPHSQTFRTIMTAYPISLSLTALMVFIALLCYHPARRFSGEKAPEKQ